MRPSPSRVPDPREPLLLRLLAAGFSPTQTPARTLSRDELDAALACAHDHRVEGLAARNAALFGYDVDATVVRRATARSLMMGAAALAIGRLLSESGVQHVFFKGVVSDELLFAGSGARGTSDVDVLVDDLAAAANALASVVSGPAIELARPWLPHTRRTRTLPVRVAGLAVLADVQSQWLSDPLGDDTRGVLARAVREHGRLPRPSLEDYAAYLGGNLVLDRFSGRLKLALDLAMLLRRDDVDWRLVVARARAWGCGGALWALASFVGTELGVPSPAWLLDELLPPRWRRRLLLASMRGAPIAGAFTRALETDSLFAGARHFVRYVPARLVDHFVDERRPGRRSARGSP